MSIIALCGYALVGKDTIEQHMAGWRRVAFADALKEACRPTLEALGLDLTVPEQKELARPILVEVGRAGRKIDPAYWVKRASFPPGDVVVPDLRYLDEARWVIGRGGIVIRIERDGYVAANEEEKRSVAEIDEALAPPVVHNDGTPAEAVAKVLEIIAQHSASDSGNGRRRLTNDV